MPEWSNGTVSKTVVALKSDPGFESLSLRSEQREQGEKKAKGLAFVRDSKVGVRRHETGSSEFSAENYA